MSRSDVAVVVIGRNEGERLDRCLSATHGQRTLYVDSGSSDGSADRARAAGAEVIELDPGTGFSAASGRNAGLERLTGDTAVTYIQLVDGDSCLDPSWIDAAAAALDADPGLGAVLGKLREDKPDASIYAWLCDVEWERPTGPAKTFGGIVLLRSAAVRTAGRFSAAMIAGEDVDFALRMRAAGWRIGVLAAPMAVHDSSLRRFGQWWRRSVRTGHAFAELCTLHPGAGFARNCRRILFWAGAVPATILTGLVLTAIAGPAWLLLPALAALVVTAQLLRVGLRERRRHGPARAFSLALFLAVGKYAEMVGLLRYGYDQRRGRRPTLIEYKDR